MSRSTSRVVLALWTLLAFANFAPSARAEVRLDPARTKSSDSLLVIFKDVVAAADRATVAVEGDVEKDKVGQVALGSVVGAEGDILTKASEVVGRRSLRVVLGGKKYPAKVVGVSEPQDLAMLKIEAKDLAVVPWADVKSKVDVGQWVASAGAAAGSEEPLAVGVVSVGRRKIAGRNGFLGVQLDDAAEGGGAKITQVIPGSAAEKAGVKVDDLIVAVNGKATGDRESLVATIRDFRPGDVVVLSVKRGEKTLDLKASLGANAVGTSSRFNMMNLMGGPVSGRASDFAAVLQHDTVIRPVDCGGPLVDLNGKVIGINIARAGRTETYALPADVILPLLEPLKNGKLAPAAGTGSGKPGDKPATRPERGE